MKVIWHYLQVNAQAIWAKKMAAQGWSRAVNDVGIQGETS